MVGEVRVRLFHGVGRATRDFVVGERRGDVCALAFPFRARLDLFFHFLRLRVCLSTPRRV